MRSFLSIVLSLSLLPYGLAVPGTLRAQHQDDRPAPLRLVEKSYLELFELASEVTVSKPLLSILEKELEREKESEKQRLRNEKERLENRIEAARRELKTINRDPTVDSGLEEERWRLHCRIQNAQKQLDEIKLTLDSGLDVAFDNRAAKLKILKEWPARHQEIQERIRSGRAVDRKFGDFLDVGFRAGPFEGQDKDIKTGREVVQELRVQGLLPPEIEDEQVTGYVRDLASTLARHSDLRIPLHVTVLQSREINAFALPGGFLFVNSGLILKAANESELSGVLAHEIAHAAARHGHRLMTKANIASIIFQVAQLAALILTGGVASIGTYYALQYGFLGLGMILSLSLLGVSRDFEIEADRLGTQYLWHAGYDTGGFIRFFGKMAEEEGYISGLSWFRTHPPFYERMETTFEEITILPPQEEPIMDSKSFRQMREKLQEIVSEMEKRDRKAPTLKRVYDCEEYEEEYEEEDLSLGKMPPQSGHLAY